MLGAREPKLRWIGHTLRAELTVTVDGSLTVEQAYRIAHDVKHELVHAVPRLDDTEPVSAAEAAHDSLARHR